MRITITLICLLSFGIANAGNLQLHGISDHSEEGDHVEHNYGVGYSDSIADGVGWSATLLRNSHDEPSLHGCIMFGGRVAFGPCAATGYENDTEAGEVLFYPNLSVRLLDTRISPRWTLIPLGQGEYVTEVAIDIRLGQ